jgi:hypothetical protein
MDKRESDGGLGSLRPELVDALLSSGLGDQLQSDLNNAAEHYGITMLQGQLLEFATKLAGPALAGPLDDDEASRRHLARSRKRSLEEAISKLGESPDTATSPDLIEALHHARQVRNDLAHGFWLWALPLIMAGGGADVVERLQRDLETFERLTQRLFEVALGPGATRRGIAVDDLTDAMSVVAALLMFQPGRFEGLHLIDDADDVLERLQQFIDEDRQRE